MENIIKLSATVVSHAGSAYVSSDDNFYMNGRTKYTFELDKIQVSIEKNDSAFIFAVYDGVEDESGIDAKTASITRELHKFQERLKNNAKSMETKFCLFGESINEVSNVIFSSNLSDPEQKGKRNSFAGLLISEGKAGAINTGNNRIFLLRSGNLKHITKDNAKLDRLMKLGIITPEQAKAISFHFGATIENEIKKPYDSEMLEIKDNDILFICNDGISDNLDDDKIQEIMSQSRDPEFIANMLVKEAAGKQDCENITALVIRIVEAGRKEQTEKEDAAFIQKPKRAHRILKENGNSEDPAKTYIAAIITILIIAAVLFAAYRAWYNSYYKVEPADNSASGELTQNSALSGTDISGGAGEQHSQTSSPKAINESPQPTATPTPNPSSGREPIKYIIQNGDSLSSISKKFYNDEMKYNIIMEKNNISDPNAIVAGETIIIP